MKKSLLTRLIALFVSSVVVLGCFTACSENESTSSTGRRSSSSSSSRKSQSSRQNSSKSRSSKNSEKSTQITFAMPDFYNMDYNEAVTTYGNNIKFEVIEQENNDLDENRIYDQNIAPGTEVNKGDTLKVKVSKGKELVEVPLLENLSLELAQDQLKQRSLGYVIKRKTHPDIEAGRVIETDPPEGTKVPKDSKIIIYVSMGISKGTVKVGDYVGKPIDDAAYMAEYAGLKVETKYKDSSEDEGTVIEQSIPSGEMVDEGTEIILYYSSGNAPEGEIDFSIKFPTDANGNLPSGRFVIDYLIYEENAMREISSTDLILPIFTEYIQKIKSENEEVKVIVTLTNIENNLSAQIGSYTLNFADQTIKVESENIEKAFRDVGGFSN